MILGPLPIPSSFSFSPTPLYHTLERLGRDMVAVSSPYLILPQGA